MARVRDFLKRLTGRLKKHMDAVFLTMGGILIPLGFYLKVEHPQSGEAGTACVIAGLIVWLLAYWFVKRKEKREQEERTEQRTEFRELFTDIRGELKKLNEGKK